MKLSGEVGSGFGCWIKDNRRDALLAWQLYSLLLQGRRTPAVQTCCSSSCNSSAGIGRLAFGELSPDVDFVTPSCVEQQRLECVPKSKPRLSVLIVGLCGQQLRVVLGC